MKKKHKKFVKVLEKYFKLHPQARITQALFNLGVTESEVIGDNHYFKDNYNEDNKVTLARAEARYEKAYKGFFKGIVKEESNESETYQESNPENNIDSSIKE